MLPALFLLALADAAWAGDILVDGKNPKASDKNPGTEAMPLKTIQKAASSPRPATRFTSRRGPIARR